MPKSATDKRHFILAAVLVAISTVLLDILLKSVLPLPVQASIESLTIDALIGWHLTLIAFLFSLVVVFMLYSVVVFRKREGDESEGEHFEGNTALEIAWTVVPLILVVVFAFYGVNALAKVTHAESNELEVQVTAQQWSWLFTYTTPDGKTFISPGTGPAQQPACPHGHAFQGCDPFLLDPRNARQAGCRAGPRNRDPLHPAFDRRVQGSLRRTMRVEPLEHVSARARTGTG